MTKPRRARVTLDLTDTFTLTGLCGAIGYGACNINHKDKVFWWTGPLRPGWFVKVEFGLQQPKVTIRHSGEAAESDWPSVLRIMGFCAYNNTEIHLDDGVDDPPDRPDHDNIGEVQGTA